MLDIEQQEFINLKAITDKDSTTDESSEGSFTSNSESKPILIKKNIKTYKRKFSDVCYAMNLLDKYGSLIVKRLDANYNNFFITKIRKIDFSNCKDLFEKGKRHVENGYREGFETIPDITFWHQRYYYYNLFDKGIKMDNESWWSVTPEELAIYTAKFCVDKVIVDGFCGSGGNVIQFSKYGKKVYAVDIDPNKIELCKNNCQVYQCKDNIEYILSDYLKTGSFIKADYVFLSPPWGGIKYKNSDVYSIKELMTPNIYDIIRTSLEIAPKIIFFLPRTLDLSELCEIIDTVLKEKGLISENIFFDVHVLRSANKIKALMIIFSFDSEEININDIKDYITNKYKYISYRSYNSLVNVVKTVGFYNFIKGEAEYKKRQEYLLGAKSRSRLFRKSSIEYIDNLISFFITQIFDDKEKVKFRKLEMIDEKALLARNKKAN